MNNTQCNLHKRAIIKRIIWRRQGIMSMEQGDAHVKMVASFFILGWTRHYIKRDSLYDIPVSTAWTQSYLAICLF